MDRSEGVDTGSVIGVPAAPWWTGTGHSSSTFPGWGFAEALHRAIRGRSPAFVLVNVRPDLDVEQVRQAVEALARLYPDEMVVEVALLPVGPDTLPWPAISVTAVGGIDASRVMPPVAVPQRRPAFSGSGAPGA